MDDKDELFDLFVLSNMHRHSGGCLTCLILIIMPVVLIVGIIQSIC